MLTTALLLASLCGQSAAPPSPSSPSPDQSAARAAAAAEKAAQAAQSAAESAAQVAATAQKLAATLTPELTVPAAAAKKTAAEKGWAGTLDLGLIWLSGNSNTLTLNGAAAFARTFHSGWILSFKASGSYGQGSAPGANQPSTVTALAASGQLRGDRVLAKLLTVYLLTGADTDHVASIELRSYGEGGVGLVWLDHKVGGLQTLLLRTDIGVRYADQRQFQYYPVQMSLPELQELSPRVGVALRYAATKDLVFSEQVEVIPDVLSPNPVLVNNTTQINAHLVGALSLAASFVLAYDSVPPPMKVSTDTALNLGAEVSF
ncbi:MAG TPA: DUF481 domain-containing protein [Myxococcales bacterium]|nr:DUF481 domain-containing protein [Myxococcales bacterium]